MWDELTKKVFLGNSITDYIAAAGIFLAVFTLIKLFNFLVLRRLRRWAEKTRTSIDDFIVDILNRIFVPLSYLGAFYAGIRSLVLPDIVRRTVNFTSMGVITIFIAYFLSLFISYGFKVYWARRGKGGGLEKSLKGILKLTHFFIWGGAVIFFLDNIGFKVSTVIAGLGIGGVAVALAAQVLLKDLFSYFSIIFDRPFEIGDFIIVGDYLGVVEYIGVKTTRIRSLGGEQLIFSNTDLTDSRVRNYKRMERRRVVFKFGVIYGTPAAVLGEISKIVEEIIKGVEGAAFDRAHFFSFGDFSLDFEVVYYVLCGDYNKYMDIQQEINLKLKKELEARGVEFAFPTQTLYINK